MVLLASSQAFPARAGNGRAVTNTCILRVDAAAPTGGNGQSWLSAYNNLQTAINDAHVLAVTVSSCQVWVKSGTYKPDGGQSGHFELKTGVSVYGGFAGTEGLLSERDWQSNAASILSGDIGIVGDASDNVYNVIYAYYAGDGTETLDGFTINSGNAIDPGLSFNGGGLWLYGSNYRLANLTIQGNNALYAGGGIYCNAGALTINNVIIRNNTASNGAGLYLDSNCNVTLSVVTFTANLADGRGGGLLVRHNNNNVEMDTVVFTLNFAAIAGGGADISDQASLYRVTFYSNGRNAVSLSQEGGGLYIDQSGGVEDVTIINSAFIRNEALYGSGLSLYSASPTITDDLFTDNSVTMMGGAIEFSNHSSPVLTNVTLSQNTSNVPGGGGGIYLNQDCHPVFRNSILWNDVHGEIFAESGGSASSASFQNSLIEGCNPAGLWNNTCGLNLGSNLADADPYFINPAILNYRLSVGSPAINKGNNTFVSGVITDLEGKIRIYDGQVDLGPYELDRTWLYLPNIHK